MPGTPEKRNRPGRAVRAPTYVNVPSPVAYGAVPDALVVTMIRVLGLCWRNGYRHTPPLSGEELARLLDRPRSTLQRHLEMLEQELGWLRRERRGSRWVLHPVPPFAAPAPAAAEPSAGGPDEPHGTAVAVEDRDQRLHGTHGTAVAVEDRRPPGEHGRRSPEEALEARQDLIQALADAGIENPARERIALDPRVEVDWIAAWQLWAEHPDRANLSNLPGYIVSSLRHRERPPWQYLRLVRLTPEERRLLERSRWDAGSELDPDLRALRPYYLKHMT